MMETKEIIIVVVLQLMMDALKIMIGTMVQIKIDIMIIGVRLKIMMDNEHIKH